MNIVTIIPARGGSKGIKNKNILKIKNKPLIYYSIDISKKIKLINQTFVSSDSLKILKISKNLGAEIIQRPKKISQDKSRDIEAFQHFYDEYRKKYKKEIDLIVHLRATTPFRKKKTIKKIIEIMIKNKKFSSLRCFVKSSHSPYKMYTRKNNLAKPLFDSKKELHSQGRQFIEQTYNHVGYADIIRPKATIQKNSMTGKRIFLFELNESEYSIDIDIKKDLTKTLFFLKNKKIR